MAAKKAGFFIILGKLGPKMLSLLVKFAKFIKIGKVGMAAGSFAGYALLFTWQFALILIGSIFLHEYGHYWAMKQKGMKTSGIYLIPFVGGAAVADEAFKSRADESYIALMGPAVGLVLALMTLGVYYFTNNPLFAAIAGWMGLVNLFNLLPVNPLDGGRVVKSVAFSLSSKLGLTVLLIGIVLGAVAAICFHLYIFGLLFLFGLLELYGEHARYLEKKLSVKVQKLFGYEMEINDSIMPPMGLKGNLLSVGAYTVLIAALLKVMMVTSHIPGSKAALEVLVDSEGSPLRNTSNGLSWWMVILLILASLAVIMAIVLFIYGLIGYIKTISSTTKKMKIFDELAAKHPDLIKDMGGLFRVMLDKESTPEEINQAITVYQEICQKDPNMLLALSQTSKALEALS